MRVIKRLLQRLLILGLGIVSVWFIVFVIFESADNRLPWFVALGITYGIAAYVVLPRAVRMGLKILQRKSVPSFTTTGDGLPGDPVNLALVGTLQQLRAAFAKVGWSEADRLCLASSWRMVRSFVLKTSYPAAPFSTLYFLDEAKTSASKRRSTTAHGSVTTYDSGAWISPVQKARQELQASG